MVVSSQSFVYHHEASSRYLPGTRTNLRKNHESLSRKWDHNVEQFNKIQPKTVAHCLAFNQEHFIEAWIRNAVQYADELLVMFAPIPWTYNAEARQTVHPDKTKDILHELQKEFPKLNVVTGNWKGETQNRNDAIKIARSLGAGWLLIVDTDEFYSPLAILHAYAWMLKNPSPVWWMRHVQFIKNIKWAILTADGNPSFQFAIDLSKVRRFKRMRIPDAPKGVTIPEEVCNCWHFSYLMPMEKLLQKFATFGHAKEVNPDWLRETWPMIRPGIENFHPVNPQAWKGVKKVDLAPAVIQMFQELRLPTTTDEKTHY